MKIKKFKVVIAFKLNDQACPSAEIQKIIQEFVGDTGMVEVSDSFRETKKVKKKEEKL